MKKKKTKFTFWKPVSQKGFLLSSPAKTFDFLRLLQKKMGTWVGQSGPKIFDLLGAPKGLDFWRGLGSGGRLLFPASVS